MPSAEENMSWQIVGRDLKLVFILPTLQTRKTAIIAALQMKEETGSMDVCPVYKSWISSGPEGVTLNNEE